jgi:hypothetical protein
VDELRKIWMTVRTESPEKRAVVELSSVMSVDKPSRKLLSQMHFTGNLTKRLRAYRPFPDRRDYQLLRDLSAPFTTGRRAFASVTR